MIGFICLYLYKKIENGNILMNSLIQCAISFQYQGFDLIK